MGSCGLDHYQLEQDNKLLVLTMPKDYTKDSQTGFKPAETGSLNKNK